MKKRKLKILFVADPLEKLKPLSDTSLAMLRHAQSRKHKIYWCTNEDIELFGVRVFARASLCGPCSEKGIPGIETPTLLSLRYFDAVFVRKDPPFDEHYLRLCWILALGEEETLFVNRPSLLARYHEKLLPLEAHAQGFLKAQDLIPSYTGSDKGALEFLKSLKTDKIISKPFLGHGGRNISMNDREAWIAKPEDFTDPEATVIQPFQEAVLKEDRRVLVIAGKMEGQFVRIPPPGGFVANLAQGGSAEAAPLSNAQKNVIARVSKFLKSSGIVFAGVDLIGAKVSEVNITSPTGFQSYRELHGVDLASPLVDWIEKNA